MTQGGEGLRAGPSRNRPDVRPVGGASGGTTLRDHTTRPRETDTQDHQIQPTESVGQRTIAASTQEGGRQTVRRKKWSNEENKQIMRSYFRATACETDYAMYRSRLRADVVANMPHLEDFTEQRIADQRRAIITRNLLPRAMLEQIKAEVQMELHGDGNNQPALQPDGNTEDSGEDLLHETGTHVTRVQQEPIEMEWENLYQKHLTQYRGSDPCMRPRIPKIQYNPSVNRLIAKADAALRTQLGGDMDLEEGHLHIYCAALTVIALNKQKIMIKDISRNKLPTQPPWERRLEMKINNLRKSIGRVQQLVNGNNNSRKLQRKLPESIKTKLHNGSSKEQTQILTDSLDTLKQQLAAYSKRLRRYREAYRRKWDNAHFERSERTFYRNINAKDSNVDIPSRNQVEEFWAGIWSNKVQHQKNAAWIKSEKDRHRDKKMSETRVTEEDVKKIIQKLANWKAPGRDGLHNFWYKRLKSTHSYLAKQFNKILDRPVLMPDFLTKGVTYLLPKNSNTKDPSQYRPITCLPTLYKILSAVICEKVYDYLEVNDILTEEQKGCRKRAMGSKEQIIIDSVILEQARKQHRNVHMAFIDYQKAFDSIPHSWLLEVLQIYNIDPKIVAFFSQSMSRWCTKLSISTTNNHIETGDMNICRGIFQGDSLSALWFCVALNPLSSALKETGYGFTIKTPGQSCIVSHLFYMDDLKVYAATKNHLDSVLRLVHKISTDIGMTLGTSKCQTVTVEKGRLQEAPQIQLDEATTILAMTTDPYKYLGILQTNKIEHSKAKEIFTNQFQKRLKDILKTKLNGRNIVKAINSYAIPVLGYSFGVVKWTSTDLENINRMIRTNMTRVRMHHPRASVERMTIPREKGGRGIVDVLEACQQQIQRLRKYFRSKLDHLHTTVVQADRSYTPLQLSLINFVPFPSSSTLDEKSASWAAKELHGRFHRDLHKEYVDARASVEWLRSGGMFPETEGFMIAIQDQVVTTRNYRKYIINEQIESDNCRKCNLHQETIEHILSGCTSLAGNEYVERHNKVATIIYLEILKMLDIAPEERKPYYLYTPPPVIENERVKIYWDKGIITDVTILHNRPDITIIYKKEKVTVLIDISIPNNNNVLIKYNEKVNKYTALKREIKQMWGMDKVTIVPVIISSMGLIPKNLKQALQEIGLPINTYRTMQKSVILDATHIVRSFLEL